MSEWAWVLELRDERDRLREALRTCWGEAYIGGMDDAITPIEALKNVIDVARGALSLSEASTTSEPTGRKK